MASKAGRLHAADGGDDLALHDGQLEHGKISYDLQKDLTPIQVADIVAKLNAEIGKIMNDPAAREQFLQQGVYTLPPQSQSEAAARLKAELAKWSRVIDETGVKAD